MMPPHTPIQMNIDMSRLSSRIKGLLNMVPGVFENYEVFNTAVNPKGQTYWAAVNYGTKIKQSRVDKEQIIKGGKEVTRTRRGPLMYFKLGNNVQRFSIVDASPAFHMRERTIPSITKFFASSVREWFRGNKPFTATSFPSGVSSGDIVTRKVTKKDNILGSSTKTEVVATPSTFKGGYKVTLEKLQAVDLSRLFLQIMEDTMDLTISKLAQLTPVIKPQYYSKGFTPEPGLLRDSYGWRQIKHLGSSKLKKLYSSKGRATYPGTLLRRVVKYVDSTLSVSKTTGKPVRRKSSFLTSEFKKSYMKKTAYPGARKWASSPLSRAMSSERRRISNLRKRFYQAASR